MATTRTIMPCPVCRTELVMAELQGIEIDTCPTCRGAWLDRGELDKMIERDAPAPADRGGAWGRSSGADEGDRYDHRHGYPKRRKSFLSELFD